MKTNITYFATCLLLLAFVFTSSISRADGGKSKAAKVFTRWELSPVADIYYRYEIINDSSESVLPRSVSVEFLNNYKQQVSFCFAINDTGSAETKYKPVLNLKKKKTAVVEYPRPRANTDLKINITSIELGK